MLTSGGLPSASSLCHHPCAAERVDESKGKPELSGCPGIREVTLVPPAPWTGQQGPAFLRQPSLAMSSDFTGHQLL